MTDPSSTYSGLGSSYPCIQLLKHTGNTSMGHILAMRGIVSPISQMRKKVLGMFQRINR